MAYLDLCADGYTPSLVSKVVNSLKGGYNPPSEGGGENREPQQKREPQKLAGKPIEVGKITISPENWGMTQYGAIFDLPSKTFLLYFDNRVS